jgi:cytochrome c-type biogenesis protein CcmH/NrfG
LELGLTYDALGRFDEAEWMFDEARRLDPKSKAISQYYQAHLEHWQGAGGAAKADPTPPEPPG